MSEQFIGQSLTPIPGSFLTEGMATGGPSLPERFTWRKQELRIAALLEEWRDYGPCRNGGGERYLRKHWFRVRTDDERELKLYFERQPKGKAPRWHLYSTLSPTSSHSPSRSAEDHPPSPC